MKKWTMIVVTIWLQMYRMNCITTYFADDVVNVSVDKIQTHMYWVSDTESAVQPGYVTRNCVYRSRKQLLHTSGINI